MSYDLYWTGLQFNTVCVYHGAMVWTVHCTVTVHYSTNFVEANFATVASGSYCTVSYCSHNMGYTVYGTVRTVQNMIK